MTTSNLLLKGLDFSTLEYYSKHFNIEVEGLIDNDTLRLNVVKDKQVKVVRDICIGDLPISSRYKKELQEIVWHRAQAIKTEFIFDYQNILHAA